MYDLFVKLVKRATPNGTAGKCPYCDSDDTQFSVIVHENKTGHGTIWCNKCKRAFSGSMRGLSYPEQKGIPIPHDLRY